MDSQRPPEPLKDRLATIIQRGHVEQRTSDEVAEMAMLECYADSRNNPKDWFPHEVLRGLVAVGRAEMEKDAARLDWLEKTQAEVSGLGSVWEVGFMNIGPTLRAAIDVAMSAATKDAK